jgi:4-amino-4-deoxy-L-arabinose transferase-like glycosyltransferase
LGVVELARLLAGALLPAALLLLTAWVIGEWALRRLSGPGGPAPAPALATAAGLGLLGTALAGLGALHWLRSDVLLALIAAVHLASGRAWARRARAAWTAVRAAPRRAAAWAAGLAAGLGPLAALALYPPTGFDATMYHLPFAAAFARAHGLSVLPDVQPPVYPQLQEVLFAAGLLLGNDLVPHLLQLASALLVAGLLLAWDPAPAAARWWAAALWLGTPHVVWMGGAAYVDLGMALQATAFVYAWTRARRSGSLAWWVVAGGSAGFAAATKHLGLFFVAAGLLVALWAAWAERRPAPLVGFAAAAALVAGPWYLRLYAETGNPLFPFFSRWFGGPDWDPALQPGVPGLRAPLLLAMAGGAWSLAGIGEALGFLLRVPWSGIFHREVFGRQAPLTPYYLALLPLLLPVALIMRETRPLVLLALAYGVAWLLTFRDLRYLLSAWPLLNLAVMAAAVAVLDRRWPGAAGRRRVAVAVALALAAPGWLYAGHRLARQGPVPVTAATRDAYLARSVDGYDAIAALNRWHGPGYTVYALNGLRLTYYAEGRLRGAWLGPARYERVLAVADDPAALDAELARLDVDYLLVVGGLGGFPRERTPAWEARFRLVREGPAFVLYRRAAAGRAGPPPRGRENAGIEPLDGRAGGRPG